MFIFLIIYNWTRSSATQPLDLIHWLHSLIWSIIHTNHSVSWYEKKTPPDLCRVICLQELALSGYSYDVLCISTHCCTFPSCHQTSIMPLCPCWGILLKILWLWEAIFIHSWGLVFVSVCVFPSWDLPSCLTCALNQQHWGLTYTDTHTEEEEEEGVGCLRGQWFWVIHAQFAAHALLCARKRVVTT